MDKLILVLYVDVQNLDEETAANYVKMVSKSLFPEDVTSKLDAITFVIPRIGGGTIIESINPKYILDTNLYSDFRLKMDVLQEHMSDFIKLKKNES
jgi:hypothetical protein